jgi:orotate phosphoribosyltransferase
MTERRLEIGPGKNRLEGFETLDIVGSEGTDYVVDVGGALPFEDETYDLIYANHVLGHIPWDKTEDTLREWVRVLKRGGALEIWVPDGYKIWQMFLETVMDGKDEIAKDGFWKLNPDKNPYLWLNGRLFTYGDRKGNGEPNWQRAIFTYGHLEQLLYKVGLTAIRQMDETEARGFDHGYINLGVKGIKPRARNSTYITVQDLNIDVKGLALKLPSDIDLVVGIPRSGLLAALLLGLYLNLPVTDVDGLCEGRLLEPGPRYNDGAPINLEGVRKVLVLDDTITPKGRAMKKARAAIEKAGLPYEFYYAAVYPYEGAIKQEPRLVDFWARTVENPNCWEWNVMHHPRLPNTCVDFDGVLCRDPLPFEDDDGEEYVRFITEVPPLVRPSYEIGWIVTSRLEKYRGLTEEWLKRNGIRYRNLVMMNYPDKASRIASRAHASYKAKVYKASKAALFIESSPVIAEEILALSGKPVLCMDDGLIAANRDETVAPLIRRFQAEIRSLKQQTGQIEDGITMKVAKRCERASRLLPSRVRHMIIIAIRCILDEGWLAFMRRAAHFGLRVIRQQNS